MSENSSNDGHNRDGATPACEPVCDDEHRIGLVGPPPAPSGAPVCKCGAGRHPRHAQRCLKGHALAKNTAALVVGHTSAAWWRAHDAARSEIVNAIIADAGFTLDDAPRALTIAADALAQARLVQESAFFRMLEAGGPLTSADRARRSFQVWLAASDRLERYVRLVGLRRRQPDAFDVSAAEWAAREDARQSAHSAAEPEAATATNGNRQGVDHEGDDAKR